MCDLWNRPKEYGKLGKKELTTQEMKKVIDDYKDIGTTGIGFTGGEPMLRNDIFELIKYTKSKGMVTHMSSNGFMLNKKIASKIMQSGLDAIGFSLDGATARTHDKIRGIKGSYDRVINSIKLLNGLNKRRKKKLIIVVVTVISTLNLHEIKDLVALLRNLEVDKISFIPFHDIGVLSNGTPSMNKHKIRAKEMKELDKVIDFLIKAKKELSIIDSSANFLKLFKYCFRDKKLPIPCYAGYATFSIDGYGDMYPCFPMMEMGLAKNVVNVRDVSLKDYWRSKELNKLRKRIKHCRKCYWNNQTEISLLFNKKKIKNL
jgi:radical SAM protein with 4Fe4S-binding SPASM domain